MSKSLLGLYADLFDPEVSILGKGPKIAPLNIFINFQKAGTIFFMFLLMIYYNNFSLGAWVYLALHGSYGIVWFIKDMVFPDKTFQRKVSLVAIIGVVAVLLCYWGIGFLMVSKQGENNPSPERIFCCIMMYVIGLVLMVLTDLQKYLTLQYKKGLISDLFLSNNRNTNYFGEVLLYSSFAVLTNHRWGFYFLVFVWSTIFVSRIYVKEQSLMKKDGYEKYKQNSYLIIFKFFKSDFVNIMLYACSILLAYKIYTVGGMEKTIKSIGL